MEFILERGLELYLIVLVGAASIVFKLLEGEAYKRYLVQADNISGSRNKYLKQLKLKYDNANRMNKHFGNVQAYTMRFFYQFRYLGVKISTMHAVSSLLLWVSVALGAGFTYLAFYREYSVKAMIMPGFASFMVLVLHQLAMAISGCNERKEELFAKMTDYLENVYPKSMLKESVPEVSEEENMDFTEQEVLPVAQIAVTKERKRRMPEKKKEEKRQLTAEEALILEELLKEYRG